jgi:hypothetical protein
MARKLLARQDGGAQRTIRPIIVDSGGTRNGTTVPTAASYQYHAEYLSVNPATSAQWTDSEINHADWEAGYELVS